MAERRSIAHLDMDAFYVAVELLRRPELRGKPVIVAGTGPRAVVTTASYEARPFGVGSAIPVAHARRRCPDLVHLPVDMAHYRERSGAVMELVAALDVPTQRVSLDEVYLDLSALADPVAQMSELVRAIRERLGLDASVGIGPKTAERLGGMGIETIGALQGHPVDDLIRRFGPSHGQALHDRSHFRDDSPVADGEVKSQSVETTFDYDISDRARLDSILAEQSERLAAGLRKRGLAGRTIAIKVRLDDWTTVTRAHTVAAPTNEPALISTTARELLRAYDPPRPVRLLGVRVASFAGPERPQATGPEPLSLLPAA